jgi:hypothetical protein
MSMCKGDDRDHTFEAKDAHRIQDEAHVGSLIQVGTLNTQIREELREHRLLNNKHSLLNKLAFPS